MLRGASCRKLAHPSPDPPLPPTQKGNGGITRRRGEDSAGQGILRFYEEDSPGFQIGPTTVLACSLVFIGLVVVLHIIGKFSS